MTEALSLASPIAFVQTPHLEGYAWFPIRLPVIRQDELRGMPEDAWCEAAMPTPRGRNPSMRRSDGED